MNIEKVYLVSPRGFCAGVDRAIKVVEDCLEIFGKPVYVKHQIVHNKNVVSELEKKGAITIEDLDEVPESAIVVFSAHGSPPGHYTIARQKNLRLIDATCPLVTKVHLEVHRFAREGYQIIYIGHKGHVETIGVLNELPGKIPFVETVDDVEKLSIGNQEKLIYLTQTTLSIDETKKVIEAIKKKYPNAIDPPREDICYATTNRQLAIKELAKHADLILIVGSKNSSNSLRLVETAMSQGKKAHLIDSVADLRDEWFNSIANVGISGGASAPESYIQEIVDHFIQKGAKKEELRLIDERMEFREPVELLKIKSNIKNIDA